MRQVCRNEAVVKGRGLLGRAVWRAGPTSRRRPCSRTLWGVLCRPMEGLPRIPRGQLVERCQRIGHARGVGGNCECMYAIT